MGFPASTATEVSTNCWSKAGDVRLAAKAVCEYVLLMSTKAVIKPLAATVTLAFLPSRSTTEEPSTPHAEAMSRA